MEGSYSILMMIILLGFIVLPIILLCRTSKRKNDKAAAPTPKIVDKISVTKSVPVSPVVSVKSSPPKKARKVKTIYIFIPEVYQTGVKKWKCQSCDMENSGLTEYCELCGASIRKGK